MGNCLIPNNTNENLTDSGKNWKPKEYHKVGESKNSMVADALINPEAKVSNDVFKMAVDELAKMDCKHLKIRGLLVESQTDGESFAKIEVLIMNDEEGVSSFIKFA